MSSPSSVMKPSANGLKPNTADKIRVLPDPWGPCRQTMSPRSTISEKGDERLSAPNDTLTFLNSSICVTFSGSSGFRIDKCLGEAHSF